MTGIRRIFESTIGLKFVMASSGAILISFVLGHMVGNLQLFLPMPEDGLHPLNRYAHMLKSTGGLLWMARLGLLVALGLHIASALKLKQRNDAARPTDYDTKTNIQASRPSYMMMLSGLVILAFLLFHLAHYTLGIIDADTANLALTVAGVQYHDVYKMVIAGFSQPLVSTLYIVANVLLGLHLHHAASSIFQTLGWRTGGYAALIDKIGPAVATVVIAGNVAMPLSVWLGIVR